MGMVDNFGIRSDITITTKGLVITLYVYSETNLNPANIVSGQDGCPANSMQVNILLSFIKPSVLKFNGVF